MLLTLRAFRRDFKRLRPSLRAQQRKIGHKSFRHSLFSVAKLEALTHVEENYYMYLVF